MTTALGCCLSSYHARDESQGTGVLPVGEEPVAFGKIPGDSHISGDILSGVNSEVGGADSMHGGLEMMRGYHQYLLRGWETIKKSTAAKAEVVNVLFVLWQSP